MKNKRYSELVPGNVIVPPPWSCSENPWSALVISTHRKPQPPCGGLVRITVLVVDGKSKRLETMTRRSTFANVRIM